MDKIKWNKETKSFSVNEQVRTYPSMSTDNIEKDFKDHAKYLAVFYDEINMHGVKIKGYNYKIMTKDELDKLKQTHHDADLEHTFMLVR